MTERQDVLLDVMRSTGTSQSDLARWSGVRQPSISQFLAGRAAFSDSMLERLLACMGYRLRVVRRADPAVLTRSDRRRWALHRLVAARLDAAALDAWAPLLSGNISRLRDILRGEPHSTNVDRWEQMIDARDVHGIRQAMIGLDEDAVALREVSPFSGVLSQAERAAVLSELAPTD